MSRTDWEPAEKSAAGSSPGARAASSTGLTGDTAAPRIFSAGGGRAIDRFLHFIQSRATLGLSPAAIALAYLDWSLHLAASPGKQNELADARIRNITRFGQQIASGLLRRAAFPPCTEPRIEDKRFKADAWHEWPFNLIHQSFLLQEEWWQCATSGVRGVTAQHERLVSFMARQFLDMASPANFILTNPIVLKQTLESGGANLLAGAANFVEDWAPSPSASYSRLRTPAVSQQAHL